MQAFKERIADEYLEKIYYFSLKKTSSTDEAEDLTQEIMLEAIQSLENGSHPNDLGAWIWKIARNRYARWADAKSKKRGNIAIDDLTDELADNDSVSDEIIRREEIALLRRELALMTHDYRTVLCEYYFSNRTVSEIAAMTSLPIGTIKRKLFESRQNIKEGMKMSRTYGTRSFSPENIEFTQNWNPETGPDGGRLTERLIPQNILLEAYDNPCTLEDLSLALGIAMPYIENEVKPLIEYGLLIKDGGKYKTGIVILPKKAQDEMYDIAQTIADRLTPVIKKAIGEIRKKPQTLLNQPFEDFIPVIVARLGCSCAAVPENPKCEIHTIRHHDGAEWALMGLEKTDKIAPWLEVYSDGRFSQIIILGNRSSTKQLEIDPSDVPAFTWDQLTDYVKTEYDAELAEIYNDFTVQRNRIMSEAVPPYLRNSAMFYSNIDFRRLVMDRLIADGTIVLREDMNRSAMGVYNFI